MPASPTKTDPELLAISRIEKATADLTTEQKHRVLDFVRARLYSAAGAVGLGGPVNMAYVTGSPAAPKDVEIRKDYGGERA